ncbi:hypothetical protein M430DRAFT_19716 [Amorphotheca resinae ATCC 22711]|uniref:Uncharacterized protein n=1 Tax=Amorphotheca resinae ATCC 22711 TaxID=857342 RepID=A0A2T3B021_AMORE|nr:hypothetical protein M430DRAFT_19716 [Amorphotheca resinae ATCC 22711]PSS16744.1 hypothetical protein M430DRAFT_19716 [Amorphotheca resinae ATCC 22711]
MASSLSSGESMGIGFSASFLEGFPDGTETRQFTNLLSLQKRLNDHRNALERKESRNQYLIFTSVPESIFQRLSDSSRSTRLLYNWKESTLVVKVTLGALHEVAAEHFKGRVFLRICNMGVLDEVSLLGSLEVQFGDFIKQPDGSWGPDIQPPRPKCVLEIGASESANRLAIEAHGWLESRDTTVELVITIEINQDIPELVLRRWELIPGQCARPPRAAPRSSASCVQSVTTSYVNHLTTITGDLTLPFDKIVGRPANPNRPLEQDFTITQDDLRLISQRVWKAQGFFP